ncbi:hypothetical protein HDE_11044 [Halotydeus destructor]|nr:hypothetical protein HDE_11044 [Halotydeus destructor]
MHAHFFKMAPEMMMIICFLLVGSISSYPNKMEKLTAKSYLKAYNHCKRSHSAILLLRSTREVYYECREGPTMKFADRAEEVYRDYKLELDIVEDPNFLCYRINKTTSGQGQCRGELRPQERYLCCIQKHKFGGLVLRFNFGSEFEIKVGSGSNMAAQSVLLMMITLMASFLTNCFSH